MAEDGYMTELLGRAYLLQRKRAWSFETLLKIERGQILRDCTPEQRKTVSDQLQANIRVARECLNDVARAAGYESSIAKILDPSFNLGYAGVPITQTLERVLERVDLAESEAGIPNLASMNRELCVQHEAYFEDVSRRIREDLAFYQLCAGLELTGQTTGEGGPEEN